MEKEQALEEREKKAGLLVELKTAAELEKAVSQSFTCSHVV